jgi:hypothetical protein
MSTREKITVLDIFNLIFLRAKWNTKHSELTKSKGKGHPCTGTEALYRLYGPWVE